jgi:uncharacterized protein YegL
MGDKIVISNPAMFAIHHAMFGLKGAAVASVEFAGHGNRPDCNVICDFKEKPTSDKFNIGVSGGTPTHNGLWTARSMLLARPEPRKIILVITDGEPDNHMTTEEATKKVMAEGIEIAAIGIGCNSVKNFWPNHAVINSIQELPKKMFEIMDRLLTDKKGTVSHGKI